jgi:autotransporter translocation and assembly factor TamB
MAGASRREWPTALGGFALGLFVAFGLVALWVMLAGGTEESFDVRGGDPHTTASDRGLIGSTYTDIAGRLQTERGAVRPVRGDLTFRIAQIVWEDLAGPDFVQAAELRGRIDTRAAAHGDIVVRGAAVRDAQVYVEQNAGKEWNYKRVFTRLLGADDDDAGPQRSFVVTDIAVRNTDVRVKLPARSFTIANLAAQLPRVDLTGPELAAPQASVARATGVLVVNDSPYRFAAENARFEFPTGRADFKVGSVTTGETRVADLSGSVGGELPGLGVRMSGTVVHARFEDVRFLSPRVPATGTATFTFNLLPLTGGTTEVQIADGRVVSEGSVVTGSATIQLADEAMSLAAVDARFEPLDLTLVEQLLGDTLPYMGTIAGTARGTGGLISFDVATRLTTDAAPDPLVSQLTGIVQVAAAGFEIRRLDATLRDAPLTSLRGIMPGLPLGGTISGRITLSGPPERAPLAINVRLEMGSGVALAEGRVDLTGAVPTYDLTGRLIAVSVEQLLEPAVPPVFVTARFSLAGSGTDPNTANARVHIEGRFTGWRAGPNDTIHIAARLQNGTVQVDTAALRLASMTAAANGSWRFAAPATGSLAYQLAFAPITPFGPYIPLIGDEDAAGEASMTGTVSGQRGAIQIAGDANGAHLGVGEWSATSLEGKYELVLGPTFPEIAFDGRATGINTPTMATYESATVVVRLKSPDFTLDVKADRAQGGGLEIYADGRIPPTGLREVIVQRARIDFGADNWALTAPAVITWADPRSDLSVRSFQMRKSDGLGLLLLEGRVLPLANADVHLETVALPIGDLQRLAGSRQHVGGFLTMNTTLRATNGVPQFTMSFQLDSAVVEGVRFAQLTGDASYQAQKLVANANAVVDTAGALQLRAELPASLRFGEGAEARLLGSGPVNVTLVSDSIALAPFVALAPDLQALAGSLSANLTVTGTVEEPLLGGSLSVRNASARVIALNQRFDSIHAVVALEGRRAVIREFVARSGGRMRASGNVEFEDLTKPMLDFTASLDRLRILGVDNQTDASVSGDAHLSGPWSAATLTGALAIADGYVPLPQVGTRALDAELARFEASLPRPGDAESRMSFMRALRIDDLRISVGENLWFVMAEANAQLKGDLTINKNGDTYGITGELEGSRGTYTLRAGPIIRRFEVVDANIRFLGGADINPAVDITARRRVIDVSGRQLDINVRIGGTMERPTLALASPGASAMPQSELLSFLLFGQPSFAVGGTETMSGEAIVGETFVGGISEMLSIELEQAVIDQLGMSLDVFQIRLGGGRLEEFGEPSLVLGEEIGNDLFLTLESGVGALFGESSTTAAAFAVRLEWRVGAYTVVRTSYEPVNQLAVLRGYSVALPGSSSTQRDHQFAIELRRRWLW